MSVSLPGPSTERPTPLTNWPTRSGASQLLRRWGALPAVRSLLCCTSGRPGAKSWLRSSPSAPTESEPGVTSDFHRNEASATGRCERRCFHFHFFHACTFAVTIPPRHLYRSGKTEYRGMEFQIKAGGGDVFAGLSVEAADNQLQTLPALKNQIPLIFKTGGEETESR